MLSIQQKAQYVLWYHKLKSPTAVKRKFRNEFGQDPPHTNSIRRWFKILWKPAAFWIAKNRVGQALMKTCCACSISAQQKEIKS